MGTTRGRKGGRLTFARGGGGGEGTEHDQRNDEVGEADGHGDASVREPPHRRRAAAELRRPCYAPRHLASVPSAAIPTAAGAALRSASATAAPDPRAPRLLDLARGHMSTHRMGRHASLYPRTRRSRFLRPAAASSPPCPWSLAAAAAHTTTRQLLPTGPCCREDGA